MTVEELIELAKTSRLLTSDQVEQLESVGQMIAGDEPARLADWMATEGWLTRWQAEQLLEGHTEFVIGKYRLLSELEAGGLGTTYMAQQGRLGRDVVVKQVARRFVNSPEAVMALHRHVHQAASLCHPALVTVLDAEQLGSAYAIVSEYIPGQNLDAWLEQYQPLPVDWALRVALDILLGLRFVHRRGLVHGRLSPRNVMVMTEDDGRPEFAKILNLGFAQLSDQLIEESQAAGEDQNLRAADYIAPERAEDSSRVDIRSDLFSVGCLLFKLLTGGIPFPGRNAMERLLARVRNDAPPPSSQRPEIRAEVDSLVGKLLARDPEARFADPHEAVLGLRELLERPLPALSPPPEPTATGAQAEPAPPAAGPPTDNTDELLKNAPADTPEPSAASDDDLDLQLAEVDEPKQSKPGKSKPKISTTASTPPAAVPVAAPVAAPVAKPVESPAPAAAPAAAVEAQELHPLLVLPTGSMKPLGPVADVAFSPNSKFVLAAAQQALALVNIADGNPVRVIPASDGGFTAVAFASVGRIVAVGSATGPVEIWDMQAGKKLRRLVGHEKTIRRLQFFDGGRRLMTASDDHSLRVWDTTNGELLQWLEHTDPIHAAVLMPGGQNVLVGGGRSGGDYGIYMWRLTDSHELLHLTGHRGPIRALQVTSDGRGSISGSDDGTIRFWESKTGSERLQLAGDPAGGSAALLMPGDRTVLSGSPQGKLVHWHAPSKTARHHLIGHTGRITGLAIAPDASQVASASHDGSVRVWPSPV